MYDGIKLNVSYLGIHHFDKLPFLEMKTGVRQNGKGTEYKVCNWHELVIMITSVKDAKIYITGSLHKFWNSYNGRGNQNFNDFTLTNIDEVLHILESELLIDLDKTEVVNLEFGINFESPIDSKSLMNRIVHWKYKTPIRVENRDYKGVFNQFATSYHAKKSIKIYTKGLQYNQGAYLMRHEVRLTSSRAIVSATGNNSLERIYLSDLINRDYLESFGKYLLSEFDNFLIVDNYETGIELNKTEDKRFSNGVNPKYWELMKNIKKRSYENKEFRLLIRKLNLDSIQKTIRERITDKLKIGMFATGCSKSKIGMFATGCTKSKIGMFATGCTKSKIGMFATVVKGGKCNKRYCPITKVNISHQKDISIFVSEHTVQKIFDEVTQIEFAKLFSKYSPKKPCKNIQELCYLIAHNVRNRYWNNQYRNQSNQSNTLF